MRNLPWQKIILSVLLLTILIGIPGCQSSLAKGVEHTFNTLSHLPDHVGNVIANIMGGLSDIGGALADQISRIIGNMTGR
jgi:hypothetical protein